MSSSDPAKVLHLYPDKGRAAGFLLLAALFVGAAFVSVREGEWQGWLGVAFFGAGIVVFLLVLVTSRPYLELTRDGFTVQNLIGKKRYRWDEIESFVSWKLKRNSVVGYRFARSSGRRPGFTRSVFGVDWTLPDSFGYKAEELCRLMESWKRGELVDEPPSESTGAESEERS